MYNSKLLGLAALLLFAAHDAGAQSSYVDIERRLTPEQLRETGLDRLTPAQLARLNQLLREEPAAQAAVPAAAPAPTAPPTAPPAAPAVAVAPAPAQAAPAPAAAPATSSSFIGLNDEPIRSRLKGSVSAWEPGTVFALENGQQWKVLKGSVKLPRPIEAPEVVVVPGIAGRWFLQVDENYPKARVYRID